jgi:hypothetical protein
MHFHAPIRTAAVPASSTIDRLNEIRCLLGALDLMAGTLEGFQVEAFCSVIQSAQEKVEGLQSVVCAAVDDARLRDRSARPKAA